MLAGEWRNAVRRELAPVVAARAAERRMPVWRYKWSVNRRLARLVKGVEVRVRVNPLTLLSVAEDGRWRTQFETGTSGGLLDPAARAQMEEAVFGFSRSGPVAERPVYGYVAFTSTPQEDRSAHGLGGYGYAIVRLRSAARMRTSVTLADSLEATRLGKHPGIAPSRLDRPRWYSADYRRGDPLDLHRVDDLDYYAETQIHGGVRTSDISSVHFTEPPLPEVTSALSERSIRWTTT